jgi:hypothetical protein
LDGDPISSHTKSFRYIIVYAPEAVQTPYANWPHWTWQWITVFIKISPKSIDETVLLQDIAGSPIAVRYELEVPF